MRPGAHQAGPREQSGFPKHGKISTVQPSLQIHNHENSELYCLCPSTPKQRFANLRWQKPRQEQLPFTQEHKNYPGKCANPGFSCSAAGGLSVRRWEQTPSGWKTASKRAVVRQSISILSHISKGLQHTATFPDLALTSLEWWDGRGWLWSSPFQGAAFWHHDIHSFQFQGGTQKCPSAVGCAVNQFSTPNSATSNVSGSPVLISWFILPGWDGWFVPV